VTAFAAAWPDYETRVRSIGPKGAIAILLTASAAADGAYFATAASWIALALLGFVAIELLLRPQRPGTDQAILVTCLLVLAVSDVLAEAHTGAADGLKTVSYVAAAAAIFVARPPLHAVTAGSAIAIASIATYAVATRLLPERIGVFDSIASYRLSEPFGYWNALGVWCAVGGVLALGVVARATPGIRAAAAASLPIIAVTLYFTFSRGAWIALAIGLAAALALCARRVQLATAALIVTPFAALIVWLASRSEPLTRQNASVEAAAHDGHRLALWLLLCCVGAAASAALLGFAERRLTISRSISLGWAGALSLAVLVGFGTVFAHFGGPLTIGNKAGDAFRAPPPATHGDLNQRLFSFSGSGRADLWRAASTQFEEHPIFGSGPGTYERYWLRHRDVPLKVRDAHSLYLETLAERGTVGLVLLLTTLLIPVYAAIKARRHPLVPAAFGAYVAYLVHAGVDWDWEMPAVTLTALFIGAAIVVAARDPDKEPRPLSPRVRAGALAVTLALMVVAFVGLVGNMALSESARAARAGDWATSIGKAERARTWAPWLSEPYKRIGDAELALSHPSRARASYRRAIDKAPNDWSLWFDLARASRGRAQLEALAHAARLNPLSPEIKQFRKELALGPIVVVPNQALP